MKPLSLYLHIPYCEHKCIYCDFYSVINSKNTERYFENLLNEIKLRSEQFGEHYVVNTIFFGGGTPTLVESKYLSRVLETIAKKFKLALTPEITIEANPGTLTEEKINDYLSFGINRLSIGVQSFFDDDLKFLTRIHSSRQAVETVELAYSKGFENINVDLIFNLPKQTKKRWLKNLETAVMLPIKHVSAYSLIIEKGTILQKMIIDGKVTVGDNDYDADLYEITQEFLASRNFNQYEVSNFAQENYACRHNLAYWRYHDYLGFGTAAHSFINPRRWKNFTSLTFYIESAKNKTPYEASAETLSLREQKEEYVMLSLRSTGLDIEEFSSFFGKDFFSQNKKLFDGLYHNDFAKYVNGRIKLTKRGYAVCDEILTKLIY